MQLSEDICQKSANTSSEIPIKGYVNSRLRCIASKQQKVHQWLFQISMKLPSAKIELGPIYDRLMHKFSFSGLKMRLAGL